MKRPALSFFAAILALLPAFSWSAEPAATAKARPNIIFILADDK